MLKNIDSDSVQPHYMAVRMFRNELHSRNDDKRRKTTEAELSDTTLTKSMMIGPLDVLPVYLLMGVAIIMMIYEAFFDKS